MQEWHLQPSPVLRVQAADDPSWMRAQAEVRDDASYLISMTKDTPNTWEFARFFEALSDTGGKKIFTTQQP